MLKRACEEDFEEISLLCRNSITGTRILCYILAYGFTRDFLEIWIIEDEGKAKGVLVKFFDDVTLLCTENADTEQLRTFIGMLHYNKLMCSAELCGELGFSAVTVKNAYRFEGLPCGGDVTALEEADYEEAYGLISREIPGSFSSEKEAYLSFLSDFTFRKRRCLARGVCTRHGGRVASVALTSSETENAAIISGVACDSNLQKRGLGKKTVLSLVNELNKNNKQVYVIALNGSAEGFYEHIGFVKTEKIGFVERKSNV